ncbi:uncharacterized protein (TIGR02271 family) [Motilibacter rhizosphaerae]|uniref:Uncharacterized protein (TIGR02271 family) n=1 Tax=Motilibacter rhizosphaerae TaxID=598652 RepID=A0A4Q7NAB1_9ACTN|nr:PRC and DUF2382 domain-containing protein [Motilibacter rhizosphaerae]RZS79414.1 uncharacterized protein (TIGR02271 family) [Motilibacter rhizosphaerae]
MFTQEQAPTVLGGTLYGAGGEKIGKIGQIFVDDESGRPEWVTVHTGLFGTHETFVPVAQGELNGNDLTVPFSKDQIKGAPNVDPENGHLGESSEDELYRYYGLSRGEVRSGGVAEGISTSGMSGTSDTGISDSAISDSAVSDTAYTDATATGSAYTDTAVAGTTGYETAGTDEVAGTTGYDTSGPTTDSAMTRSEERLRAGTETVEAGRARLRKWVETEQESVTVPVTKERARLVTEPITDANAGQAYDGPAISEEEHEVVLREERPVVATEAVPVERVRLETEQETRQETVTGEVRKERIDLDSDQGVDVAGDAGYRGTER